jgi:CheY-like chemotaxis protein
MQMATEVDILLRNFDQAEREAFLGLGERVAFAAGEVILPAGRSEWDTYIIQQGEASIWVGNARLADLQGGQTLGTAAILAPQIQWSAVRGNTDGVLLRLPREAMMKFFEGLPTRKFQQFCLNVFRVWVEVLKQRNERIAQMQAAMAAVARPERDRRCKILVVDDEVEICRNLEEFFALEYDVVTAGDGRQAVERALAEKPDLILLDLRLPEIDGYQVCKRLKTNARTERIPIVMLTALTATPDKVKGIMYGADEYLNKPVDLPHLADTVRRVLKKVHGA